MEWILLPRQLVDKLAVDSQARWLLATGLHDGFPSSFGASLDRDHQIIGAGVPCQSAQLILLWWPGEDAPYSLVASQFLSFYTDTSHSTAATLEESDRAELIRRACQLALRLWDNAAFPDSWHAKRVQGFDSIYAGDRRLQDLRLTYGMRQVGRHRLVDIGELYYARRRSGSLQSVP